MSDTHAYEGTVNCSCESSWRGTATSPTLLGLLDCLQEMACEHEDIVYPTAEQCCVDLKAAIEAKRQELDVPGIPRTHYVDGFEAALCWVLDLMEGKQ